MTLTYLLCARKSSRGETKQVQSIDDQLRVLRALRSDARLHVKLEYTEARSATKPDVRPLFREMLDRIKDGEANAILCWHVNRLYRNQKEYGEVAYLLQTGAIQCIKTPEREYHPEDHSLLMAVEASMATQFVRDLRRDVQRRVAEKANRGWYPYKPKAGYVVDRYTKELLPDATNFPLLRRASEMFLTPGYTVEQARRELNGMGYRTPKTLNGHGEQPMTRSGMYRFLSDRFYRGEFLYEGIWRDGKHRPLVSREEFAAMQTKLRRPLKERPQTHRFAYTGLITCGVCGCQITAEKRTKRYRTSGIERTYTYYHCTGRKGCRKLSISESEIEDQILNYVDRSRLDPDFIEWSLQELKSEREGRSSDIRAITQSQSTALRSVTMKLDSLWDMRHANEISGEEFKERKAKYDQEASDLKNESHRIASKEKEDRSSLEKALVFSRDSYEKFSRGDVSMRRQVASEFALSYVLTLDVLQITPHPILARFIKFEPKSHQSQQIGPGGPQIENPDWRTFLDDIRTLVADSNLPFPSKAVRL